MREILAAFRQFRKTPGFAITVILTIALGIGANTAIFTLVHAVLLRSLPVHDSKALYLIGKNSRTSGIGDAMPADGDYSLFSYDLYRHMRETTPGFAGLAAMQSGQEGLAVRQGRAQAKNENIEYVSGNYFSTLGVRAFAGRLLTARDDAPGAAPAVVMSYAAWQADFGGNPHVVGSTFTFQQHPITVVGIGPMGFFGDRVSTTPPAFWIPLNLEPLLEGSFSVLHGATTSWLYLLGRVKPGVSIAALEAQMSANLEHWLGEQPALLKNGGGTLIGRQRIWLTPGGGGVQQMQQDEGSGLYLLMAISGLVLLVACGNVANLLLARGTAQRAAISLRMALGAARSRIVRQMLVESVTLACIGGAAGLALAYAGTRTILSLAFPHAPRLPIQASPSLPVLGFAFLLALVTGLVFGVVPAWITSHADPAEALRGANRSTRDRAATPQRVLIVFQAALSLVLLVGAGLLTRSLAHLEDQNLGIATANRYVVNVDPASAGYTAATLPALYQAMQDRFGATPGVAKVGMALYSPLAGMEWSLNVIVDGRLRPPAGSQEDVADYDRVSPQFFAAVGERVARGRAFTDQDTATSQPVAVVNEAFARHFFPMRDAIGRSFRSSSGGAPLQIVGVVANANFTDPSSSTRPMYFMPLTQPTSGSSPGQDTRSMFIQDVVLDFATPPVNVDALVRRTLGEINPNLSVNGLHSLAYQVNNNFTENRLLARLAMLFGLLALVLAAVGLYGITSYQVARRTSEIGVRMALGATRGDVLRMVLRGAFAQIGLGLAIGMPVAILGAHSVASQLYRVKAYDPISLLLATLALSIAAAVAGLVPALRAASIEPVTALRME